MYTCLSYSTVSLHTNVPILPGADVVLGHVTKTNEGGIPVEQQLCRYRHSPGSGVLTVELRPDGPTRVLCVSDHNKKVSV